MNSTCPQCSSKAFKRNGYTRHGKQNHRCLDCGRQFSVEARDAFNSCEESEASLSVLAALPAPRAPSQYL